MGDGAGPQPARPAPQPPRGPQYGQRPVPGRPVLAHGPDCGQPVTGPASHPPGLGPGALSSLARRQPPTPFPGGGISPQKRDPWRSVPGHQPGGAPVGAWLWSGAGGAPLVLSEGMSCVEGGGASCCWLEDGDLGALRTMVRVSAPGQQLEAALLPPGHPGPGAGAVSSPFSLHSKSWQESPGQICVCKPCWKQLRMHFVNF